MAGTSRPLDRDATVGVVGAGTMGGGIAQVALLAGHHVVLYDVQEGAAARGAATIAERLDRLVDKKRLTAADRAAASGRLRVGGDLEALAPAAIVVEAVVEDLGVKRDLFGRLEQVVSPETILATNTSSLSISDIAEPLRRPGRVVGMHFFNPAPVLPLVEVVSGSTTDPAVAAAVLELARAWGKTPVHAASTPGFIVNRVARPFYGEAFAAYENGLADPATVDAVLRDCGGFRMGAFELTDLIGHDVNFAVSHQVWDSLGQDGRFRLSPAQQQLVEEGRLGRKTGQGWFSYGPDAPAPEPAVLPATLPPRSIVVRGDLGPFEPQVERFAAVGIRVERTAAVRVQGGALPRLPGAILLPSGGILRLTDGLSAEDVGLGFGLPAVLVDLPGVAQPTGFGVAWSPECPQLVRDEAVGLLQVTGARVYPLADVSGLVVARVVAQLVNVAADAVAAGVATPADIDLAMIKGVNYPRGPLEWGDALGLPYVVRVLHNMWWHGPSSRYEVSPLLRDRAAQGGTLR